MVMITNKTRISAVNLKGNNGYMPQMSTYNAFGHNSR